jgi:transposase
MEWSAGLDWGSERHAVCVVDRTGKIVAHFEVAHDAAGLSELRKKLARISRGREVPIAIERPTGLIIDALVDAGHVVVPIHPNVVKACRPRYRAASSKSDLGDSYLLADVLRTDGHRFRPLVPQSDAIKALRALVRTRDDLVAQRVATANQLRALLETFWPGAAAIFCEIDSPIALAFVQRFPTPMAVASLGPKRLESFLRQHHYCGRRSATELLERLHAAPSGLAGTAELSAKGELVVMLARVLQAIVSQLAILTARTEREVAHLADGKVVMSFPLAGKINAAQILAELGDVRERFQTEEQLAAEAGVSPVTHQSGKSRAVTYRWACNHRLRLAITNWANNSRRQSPWANDVYARARARGCDHPHAVRILARAWIRILWRAWVTRTAYDPANHGAAKNFPLSAA